MTTDEENLIEKLQTERERLYEELGGVGMRCAELVALLAEAARYVHPKDWNDMEYCEALGKRIVVALAAAGQKP